MSAPRDAEGEARDLLAAALYHGRRREVELYSRELSRLLGGRIVGDEYLAVARVWLREQAELRSIPPRETRSISRILVLTGAPVLLATFLTGLLGVVMLFSA